MDTQETILRGCTHKAHSPCEVDMGAGETLAVCVDCWNAGVAARRAERKAQLDAMPRCEVPGCRHRQTVIVNYQVGLCGRHAARVRQEFHRQFAGAGIFAIGAAASLRREDVLKMAAA